MLQLNYSIHLFCQLQSMCVKFGALSTYIRLVKFCTTAITKPVTAIINQSLLNGIFPDNLKNCQSNTHTVYKKGDVNHLNNYIPISLLQKLSKIFERVVHSHTQIFH